MTSIACSNCAKWLRVDEALLGKRVLCPYCHETIEAVPPPHEDKADKLAETLNDVLFELHKQTLLLRDVRLAAVLGIVALLILFFAGVGLSIYSSGR